MDFAWSEDQNTLYQRILNQTRTCLGPKIAERGRGHFIGRDEWELCGQIGLLGLSVPVLYNGMGLDCLSTARMVEAFGLGCEDTGLVFATSAHLFACTMPILEYGNNLLKERMLSKLCTGEWIGSNAITETEAGSDVFAMNSYAVRDGDEYILNGTKSYVTNGPVADIMLVYAKTDPTSGFLGVSAFVVESGTPGLLAEEPFEKMGLISIPAGVVHLNDCRVPVANRLAAEGQGGLIFNRSMQWERTGLFAGYLGMMQRQFDLSVDRARKRRQFGKPIGKNQAISHRIVDMKLRLEAARLLLARACWRLDRGEEATVDVSLAKLAISEAAVQSSMDAALIFGGEGFTTNTGIEQGLWDAMASTLVSGTSEIQREIIAGQLRL